MPISPDPSGPSAIRPERRARQPRPLPLPGFLSTLAAPLLALLPQLSRYVAVSALALGLDVVVFIALAHVVGIRAAWAGLVGYVLGLGLHFVLSTRYVFERRGRAKSERRLVAEFAATGLVGTVMTWVIIAAGVEIVGLPPLAAKLIAIATSFLAVYLLRRSVVFDTSAATAG